MTQYSRLVLAFAFASLPALCEDWNPRLAAEYLDSRQKEWFAWKPATAPGGPCISCHTGVTYLFARPALRQALGERERTPYEAGLLTALRARVDRKDPKQLLPIFSKEPLASQALGVEAILAALFLTSENTGNAVLSAEARQAFDRMWGLQIQDGKAKGTWPWFELNLDPWETTDSKFYGAALVALATGMAPAEYRDRAEVRPNIAALTEYLQREQQEQPLHNRLALLWASTKLHEALAKPMKRAILDEVWRKQQPDGGWTMDSLGPWKEHPAAPPAAGSNSYATGVVAFTLRKAGVARSDKRLIRALDWLRAQQDRKTGSWQTDSMNKRFEPGSMQIGFMRDAATAFAALALLEGGDSAHK